MQGTGDGVGYRGKKMVVSGKAKLPAHEMDEKEAILNAFDVSLQRAAPAGGSTAA